jgi:hypothetical protein
MAVLEEGNLGPYLAILVPLLAVVANVASQVLLLRARRGKSFLQSIVEGLVVGLVVLFILEACSAKFLQWSENSAASVVVDLLTYLACSYCYFHLVCLGQTSIRIRIYSEIAQSDAGLTWEEISRVYDSEQLMRLRFERLLGSGDIIEKNGRYYAGKRRLVYISRLIGVLKNIVIGKPSEFE